MIDMNIQLWDITAKSNLKNETHSINILYSNLGKIMLTHLGMLGTGVRC